MKRKLKIWFPIHTTYQDEIEVEVPDDVVDFGTSDWLIENELRIIESHPMCEGPMDGALEVGYAGTKPLEDSTKETKQHLSEMKPKYPII
jgi:hypothetical protein